MEKVELSGGVKWVERALRTACAVILLQTLYFKFSAAPESVFIFSSLGIEPWGRYFTGACELVASILLLAPFAPWLGAFLSAGLMAGALAGHFTKLGIEVQGDGGLLFGLALFVFIASGIILYFNRAAPLKLLGERVPSLKPKLQHFYK